MIQCAATPITTTPVLDAQGAPPSKDMLGGSPSRRRLSGRCCLARYPAATSSPASPARGPATIPNFGGQPVDKPVGQGGRVKHFNHYARTPREEAVPASEEAAPGGSPRGSVATGRRAATTRAGPA
jgi:hypothetical protein